MHHFLFFICIFIFTAPAWAVGEDLRVKVRIVRCVSYSDVLSACSKRSACCELIPQKRDEYLSSENASSDLSVIKNINMLKPARTR